MNIIFFILNKRIKAITGGHLYDDFLLQSIKKHTNHNITFKVVGTSNKLPKVFKPFIESRNVWKNKNADILYFNSSCCIRLLPALLALRFFSSKKIYTIHHHFLYLEFKGLKKWVYKYAEILFLKNSHKIVVPSPYIYTELKNYKNENNLLLWRIPFDTKPKLKAQPIPGKLTFAGTIEPRKGIIFLLKALKILKDRNLLFELNILGKVIDESYYNSLKAYVNNYNLKVNFLGFVESDIKDKIFSETDVFVFPSLLEGYGMALVEAQVYGLPIVSFDNSAMPINVKNNINGFAVPTGDCLIMANKIQQIISDRVLRDKLSNGALENLKEQWSLKKFESTVAQYFSNLK